MRRKRLFQWMLRAGAGAAGIFLLALAAFNGWLNSASVHARLQQSLEKSLGAPARLGRLSLTPWGGLRAGGFQCEWAGGERQKASASLSAASLSARVSWGKLFSGRLEISRLRMEEPSLLWMQGEEGSWALERPRPAPPLAAAAGLQVFERAKSPTGNPPERARKGPSLELALQTLQIRNATLRWMDGKGATPLLLEGVRLECEGLGCWGDWARFFQNPARAAVPQNGPRGWLSVARATVRDGVALESVRVPLEWKEGRFFSPALEARLAGGWLRGEAAMRPQPASAGLWTLDLRFDGVDLKALLEQLGQKEDARRWEGLLHGNVDLYGRFFAPAAPAAPMAPMAPADSANAAPDWTRDIQGGAHAWLEHGRLEPRRLFQFLGSALQIEEFRRLELEKAWLDLRAAEGRVFIDGLTLESANMGFKAMGESDWNGTLRLDARLALAPKVSRQLPAAVDSGFAPVAGSDRRDVGFHIGGSLSSPESDLPQVLLGEKYGREFMNLWRFLTNKKKESPFPSPAPAPAGEESD